MADTPLLSLTFSYCHWPPSFRIRQQSRRFRVLGPILSIKELPMIVAFWLFNSECPKDISLKPDRLYQLEERLFITPTMIFHWLPIQEFLGLTPSHFSLNCDITSLVLRSSGSGRPTHTTLMQQSLSWPAYPPKCAQFGPPLEMSELQGNERLVRCHVLLPTLAVLHISQKVSKLGDDMAEAKI